MGIGFVILIWIIIFGIFGTTYLFLRFFAEQSYMAGVIKDAFISLVAVFILSGFINFSIRSGDLLLQKIYPPRIFSKHFGFSPPADIEIISGSAALFDQKGVGTVTLNFLAAPETIQKIIDERNFVENQRSNFVSSEDPYLRNMASNKDAQFYFSNSYKSECDEEFSFCTAFLVYDKQSREAYFHW